MIDLIKMALAGSTRMETVWVGLPCEGGEHGDAINLCQMPTVTHKSEACFETLRQAEKATFSHFRSELDKVNHEWEERDKAVHDAYHAAKTANYETYLNRLVEFCHTGK